MMQKQRFYELKMTKTLLFLTEGELISLLKRDIDLWAKAVQRGKGILRARAARVREERLQELLEWIRKIKRPPEGG